MFQNLIQLLDTLSKKFLDTLKRFPLVSFFAFFLTLILVIFSDANYPLLKTYPNFNIANKVAFTTTLAIPLFLVLRLISNNRLLTLLGMILIVVYYIFLPDSFEKDYELMQRHVLFILALVLFIFPAPFLFHSIKNIKFWEWTQQIVFAFISALLFGLILYLGLQGAIYAFKKLFYLKVNYDLSQQLLLVVFGIFSVNYFLAQIPKYPLLLPLRPYTKIENIFTKYILTPLSIAYFLILYLYTFKQIYLLELPSGLLAWLILIFSLVAMITFLFWTPLWDEKTDKYKKWVWVAILFQTIVLGLSIYLRIEQYGITQNRYFIAVMGLWLFCISLYFIFYKNALYKWLFISLSILIIFTQVSYFSAYTVAQESQTKQLRQLLTENPNLSEESEIKIRYRVSSSIDYLYSKHGIDSLMPILPEVVTAFKLQEESRKDDCTTAKFFYFSQYATNHLGFKYIDKWQWEHEIKNKNSNRPRPIRIYSNNKDISLSIQGYEWVQDFSYDNYGLNNFCPSKTEASVPSLYTIVTKEKEIILQKELKEVAIIKMESFFNTLKENIKNRDKNNINIDYYQGFQLTQKELTYIYQNNNIEIKLLLKNIDFTDGNKLSHYHGILLIHEK